MCRVQSICKRSNPVDPSCITILSRENKSKIITLCLAMKNVIKTENDTVLGFCVEQLYVF